MSEIRIAPPSGSCGPRIVVGGIGRGELTVSEATDLHRRLGEALLLVAKRYQTLDPRIVEDAEP